MKNYAGFISVDHTGKVALSSVRDLNKSPHWKQLDENLWKDTSRNRVFYQVVKDVSEREARLTVEFFIAGFERSGYKKIPNTI